MTAAKPLPTILAIDFICKIFAFNSGVPTSLAHGKIQAKQPHPPSRGTVASAIPIKVTPRYGFLKTEGESDFLLLSDDVESLELIQVGDSLINSKIITPKGAEIAPNRKIFLNESASTGL